MWPLKWMFLLGLVVMTTRSLLHGAAAEDKDGYQGLFLAGMILGGFVLSARDLFLLVRRRATETAFHRSSRLVSLGVGGLATAVLLFLALSGRLAG